MGVWGFRIRIIFGGPWDISSVFCPLIRRSQTCRDIWGIGKWPCITYTLISPNCCERWHVNPKHWFESLYMTEGLENSIAAHADFMGWRSLQDLPYTKMISTCSKSYRKSDAYNTGQEICPRFALCRGSLWLVVSGFQPYPQDCFTDTDNQTIAPAKHSWRI